MLLTANPPKPDQSEAADRLIRVNILNSVPTTMANTVVFKYNGLGQRVGITEKHGDVVLSDKTLLWVDGEIVGERNATGTTVSKRYFSQGFQNASGDNQGNYYYSKDHLGSIREVTNAADTLVSQYDYDLWGRHTNLINTMEVDFGYTGFFVSRSTGLDLTWFRAFNAETGRWLSRDPLGETAGINFYAYVGNEPSLQRDTLGLIAPAVAGAYIFVSGVYIFCVEFCVQNPLFCDQIKEILITQGYNVIYKTCKNASCNPPGPTPTPNYPPDYIFGGSENPNGNYPTSTPTPRPSNTPTPTAPY